MATTQKMLEVHEEFVKNMCKKVENTAFEDKWKRLYEVVTSKYK